MATKSNKNSGTNERLAVLEERFGNLAKDIADIKDNHLATIDKKLDKLSEMFQTRLPMWASILFTLLTSGCIGLLVLYLSTIGKI